VLVAGKHVVHAEAAADEHVAQPAGQAVQFCTDVIYPGAQTAQLVVVA
jgi:hypothetical protein